MQFIAANTTIPVPKAYQTRWSGNRTKLSQIATEYIPGESLDAAWGKLTHDQRVSVYHQLRDYLSQLQKLESKTKRIEAANGGPITSARYARAAVSDDHEIHFGHGDFSPRNIMVWSRRFWTGIEQVGTLGIGTRIGSFLKTLEKTLG
ncbi:hypothetical protein ACJ73_08768 [Blastomyces percursus]|uniref:Aminoglycoside phosphotransferase domain-containing protein n=1 Tax=Blastomyces percursus TaxID=1658174 RepID=A0A1J9PPI3_9EURO|nr:hypothetical protein ACJ73_08768 [Blastomyces percursus]